MPEVNIDDLRQHIQSGVGTPLPRYKCHKIVHAIKIRAIVGQTITPDDDRYGPFVIDPSMYLRYKPTRGDYYVVYDDGYKSFSPAKAFEDGYTLIEYFRLC